MRRVLVVLSVLALALAGVVMASPAEAATVKRSVSLSAPAKVTVGTNYTVSGKVTRSPKRTKVYVQRVMGRSWVTVKTVRTTSTRGSFSLRVKATSKGAVTYRAKVAKQKVHHKTLKAAVSRGRTVTIVAAPVPVVVVPGATSLVSTNSTDWNVSPALSKDGRHVAFASTPDPFNGTMNVYVRDTQTGTLTPVSVASDGGEANDWSIDPTISADGRYVAFKSFASNLVTGDTNESQDVFVRDLKTDTTVRVSVATDGAQAEGDSYFPAISANGQYVTYSSDAANLVTGDTNSVDDAFVTELTLQTDGAPAVGPTTRVSVAADGTQGNGESGRSTVSDDGLVAYLSWSNNLVSGDRNDQPDYFVTDAAAQHTTLVSTTPHGFPSGSDTLVPMISADGQYVAYMVYNSHAGVYRTDLGSSTTKRVVAGVGAASPNADVWLYGISDDGSKVVTLSKATNLVAGDTNGVSDVFVTDAQTGSTMRVSVGAGSVQQNGEGNSIAGYGSGSSAISGDGRWVGFDSTATNLVAGTTDGIPRVYVRGPLS